MDRGGRVTAAPLIHSHHPFGLQYPVNFSSVDSGLFLAKGLVKEWQLAPITGSTAVLVDLYNLASRCWQVFWPIAKDTRPVSHNASDKSLFCHCL